MRDLVNVTIDDADDSVVYAGIVRFPWSHVKAQGKEIHNGTLTEITGPGTLGYGFVGSQVWLYGTVYTQSPTKAPTLVTAEIFLDVRLNAEPVAQFTTPAVHKQQNNMLFWDSGPLQYTHYSLYINIIAASDDNPFAFDYLVYTTRQALSSPPLPISVDASRGSSTSLSNALSLTPSPSTSLFNPTSVAGSSNFTPATSHTDLSVKSPGGSAKDQHTGAIVGGVIGVIVLFMAFLVVFWWLRRRAHGPATASETDKSIYQLEISGGIIGVSPFLLPRDHNTTSAAVVQRERAGPMTAGVSGIPVVEYTGKALQARGDADTSQQMLLAPEPNDETSGERSNEPIDAATKSTSVIIGQDERAGLSLSRPPRSAHEGAAIPRVENASCRVERIPPVYTES